MSRVSRSVEDGQIDVESSVDHFLGHGCERRNADAARQCHYVLRIAKRLIVELSKSHGSCQNIADLQLVIDIVTDEAVALGFSDRDLHKRFLRSRLIRRGRNGIRSGDQTLPDPEIKHNVLPRIEEGQLFAVSALEADGLGRLAGRCDLRDHQLDRAGMPLAGDVPDGVHIRERGRR